MPAYVPAAARTMTIFETFANARRELSNSEIARLLGVAESSSSDLLHTLHEVGYLMRTARTKRFYPTARLRSIANDIARNDPMVSAGVEALELLSERTGETAICGVLGHSHVDVIAFREGRYELRYVLQVGTRVGLHVSSLGKALLAELPATESSRRLRAKSLKRVTPQSVVDVPALERQLREVRKRGYARVDDEGAEGVSAMAVAGLVGHELMAVSIAGPSDRLRRHRAAYVKALLDVKALAFRNEPDTSGSDR
jgi:DNA-binding IclR family transcriptional regulator